MLNLSKSYDELIGFETFEERLEYLLLHGCVANETFGNERYLNQVLYHCPEWSNCRKKIILRDNANDLGVEGFEIYQNAIVHHINPISVQDILDRNPMVFDPNNLITTKLATHNIIHYGSIDDIRVLSLIERSPNDTSPWRR